MMGKRKFYPQTKDLEPFPDLEKRMEWYDEHAGKLSVITIKEYVKDKIALAEITYLINVSCNGMNAPGIDL